MPHNQKAKLLDLAREDGRKDARDGAPPDPDRFETQEECKAYLEGYTEIKADNP